MENKKKSNPNPNPNNEETLEKEINIDELEQVTGGSIKDVKYTQTSDISEDTKGKI